MFADDASSKEVFEQEAYQESSTKPNDYNSISHSCQWIYKVFHPENQIFVRKKGPMKTISFFKNKYSLVELLSLMIDG